MNISNSVVKDLWPVHRFCICEHMHCKKEPKRNNSGYLMKLTQKKVIAKLYGHVFILFIVSTVKTNISEILILNLNFGNISYVVFYITTFYLLVKMNSLATIIKQDL